MEDQQVQVPAWYQSSQGPQLSATVKATIGLLLPTLKIIFPHFTLVNEQVDAIIDAVMILGFAAYGLWGYVRSKRTLQGQIQLLKAVSTQAKQAVNVPSTPSTLPPEAI